MNLQIFRELSAVLLLALPLAGCVSTTTHLYRGDMELLAVSGEACSEIERTNGHIPLEMAMERNGAGGQLIAGYLNGPEIQTGHFYGNDLANLLLVYPDEAGLEPRGHTIALTPTPDGMIGELSEKPPGTPAGCYFERADLKLKLAATGNEATAAFNRDRKLFSAEEHFNRGQMLLKANNPKDALRELKESFKLHNEVDPNDLKKIYPALSIAIAQEMAGREGEALAILRDLFKEKPETGINTLKLRIGVSTGLCTLTIDAGSDELQKAAEQFLNAVAREFSGLNGVGSTLAECYRELGQEHIEQRDPDLAMEYFQKALKLNPDDADSIAGVIIGNIARETPAEGRRFLQDHAQVVIEKAGRANYNAGLSHLYAAEAKQAEKAGDYARAEQLLREALKILPGERALIIGLSTVLEKAAKPDEAQKLLEDARKGCSDDPCRREYTEELARQERIQGIVKRLERKR